MQSHSSSSYDNSLDHCEAWLSGFSCPDEHFNEQFFQLLVSQYVRNLTQMIIERYADHLQSVSQGLIPFIRGWIDSEERSLIRLDPCFGDAVAAAKSGDLRSIARTAAGIALHLEASGNLGDWSLELEEPVQLRWGNHLLPVGNRLNLTARDDGVIIESTTGSSTVTTTFQRTASGWSSNLEDTIPEIQIDGGKIPILPKRALFLTQYPHLLDAAIEQIEPTMTATLQAAVGLIQDHAPVYVPWIRRTISHLFLLRPLVQRVESGSMEHYPGLVHVSAYSKPEPIAELLVHEASHQYFNFLCRLGPFDDRSDTTEYYSPAVYRSRPLDRIGIAYHAFANIQLFYALCLQSAGSDKAFVTRRLNALRLEVAELEKPLRNNCALTKIGRALCCPLMSRLT